MGGAPRAASAWRERAGGWGRTRAKLVQGDVALNELDETHSVRLRAGRGDELAGVQRLDLHARARARKGGVASARATRA